MQIIISIDGLSKYDIDLNVMKNLKSILNDSTYYHNILNNNPTVTWPIHTSISTGKTTTTHGVLGNTFLDEKGNVKYYWQEDVKKEDIITTDTFYDVLKSRNKKIASICWPLTQGASTIDYNIPEFYSQEEFDRNIDENLQNELLDKGYLINNYGEWSYDTSKVFLQDELTQQLTEYFICEKDVDVVMAHFLSIDTMEHVYGCNSKEAIYAMRFIDKQIGAIVQLLKEKKLYDDASIVIFSDHGQSNIKSTINLKKDLQDANLSNKVKYTDDGGTINFYIENELNIESIEKFINEKDYFQSYVKQNQVVSRIPNLQAFFIEGIVTTEYGQNYPNGATHGFDARYCDRMNTFAIHKTSSNISKVIEEMKIEKIYEIILGK